jgi:beta-aspartyl-peptidase (threonine type)
METGQLEGAALVVHGGAGTFERLGDDPGGKRRARLEAALGHALDTGWDLLLHGEGALRAAVEAVASMEDSGLFNAGAGATRTTDGTIETDAGVMDGRNGAAGGVCATTWPANPVRAASVVARRARNAPVLEAFRQEFGDLGTLSTPKAAWNPLLLAGAGADRMAAEAGLARMRPTGPPDLGGGTWGPAGTVGAVALDVHGHVAAATSTGGRAGQPPGRVGDSAIIGAGTWADDATSAISATGDGEAFALAGFAHRVDWAMRSGVSLEDSLLESLAAVYQRGGTGGAIAICPGGHFAAVFNTPAMARGWRDGTGRAVRT